MTKQIVELRMEEQRCKKNLTIRLNFVGKWRGI